MKQKYNKDFWAAAGMRALRTWAQAFLAALGTELAFDAVNWGAAAIAATAAAALSFITSIATGLPEAKGENDEPNS